MLPLSLRLLFTPVRTLNEQCCQPSGQTRHARLIWKIFFPSFPFCFFRSSRLVFFSSIFFLSFLFPSVSYSNFCLSFFLCSLTLYYLISYSVSPTQVIYLNKTPEEAFRLLTSGNSPTFLPFRYVYDFVNDFHFGFFLSNLLPKTKFQLKLFINSTEMLRTAGPNIASPFWIVYTQSKKPSSSIFLTFLTLTSTNTNITR